VFTRAKSDADFSFEESRRAGEDFCRHEFEISGVDGRIIPIVYTISSFRDGHGNVVGKMHVFEDITDRKRLETDLKLSESKYRGIFEGSKDMIFIHSRGGILKDVNQACVEMLGYGSKQKLLSLASVERIYTNPLHRQVFQEQIDRHGFVKDFETAFKKQDGTRILCLVSGNAVRDANGKIIGYEAIAKDITARMDGVRNLHQQHRELSLLHSVAVAMNVTQELDEILMTALKKVLDVLNLSSGGVVLIDRQRSSFLLKAQRSLLKDDGDTTCRIILHDKALMHSLLREDRTLRPQRTFPPFRATLRTTNDNDSVQLTCFLITTKEKASGFFALQISPNRPITEQDHHMLGSLGNFLGSAIENACLLQTIRRHREELRGLTARLFHSQEEERKRIAQELHDEAGQALTGISFTLETIEKNLPQDMSYIKENVLDIKKQINRTYQEMRRTSHRLHPALLSDLGLEPALESCLTRISKHSRLEIDFKMVGFGERLDPEVETVLYRISQEAINNTLKHSRARHFKLSIIRSYPNIIFLAEDDGVGFDSNRFEHNQQALGLLGMRERASMLGGSFSLRASKGKGTRIRIEIPIKESYRG
jgi:PAS domain S-box-containing protein